jgi:hypothetical protein
MKQLSAARILAALVAAVAIAGTALAVDPSGSPSASPATSASAAAPSPAESSTPSVEPSRSAPSSPLVAPSQPVPSSATKPQAVAPENEDGDDAPPSAEKIADVVGRLKAAGVPATSAQLQDLSGKVGLGGAVRVLAFADASGKTPAQILAMFTGGMGWGRISHELNLSIGPGIGWIMGNGHGKGHAKNGVP